MTPPKRRTIQIVPIGTGYRGDEKYVDGEPLLQPPTATNPEEAPNPFGPNATTKTFRPYTARYRDSPSLDSLNISHALAYGYIRGLNWTGNECYASHATIAAAVGVQIRYIRRVLADLEEWGFIRSKPQTTDRGAQSTNIYEARLDI